jgi:hypothetical protein
MDLTTRISPGEFLDKLSILEIKLERIREPAKLANVRRELELLRGIWSTSPLAGADVTALTRALKTVNEALWEIEDRLRVKEARGSFDQEFIELARSVYRNNDRRAALKRELNLALRSDLIEEKSYGDGGAG